MSDCCQPEKDCHYYITREECVNCEGLGTHENVDGHSIKCLLCNGKGFCRGCDEDGGCDHHGWGKPLKGEEFRSALLSSIEGTSSLMVVDWLKGHGCRLSNGSIVKRYKVNKQGLISLVFDTRLTKVERKQTKRLVTIPHRCGKKPCLDEAGKCLCQCLGCFDGRRAMWAKLGY